MTKEREASRQNSLEELPAADSGEPAGKDLLQVFAATMGLAGLAVYIIQYRALEAFYQSFDGLTPEQVGLDKATMLTRLSIWIFLLTLMGGGLCVFLAVLQSFVSVDPQGQLSRSFHWLRRRSWWRTLVASVVVGAWLTVWSISPVPGSAAIPPWLVGVMGGLFAAPVIHLARQAPRRHRRWLRSACMMLLFVVPLGLWADGAMSYRGDEVARTGKVGFLEQGLGVRVQYAYARYVHGAGLPEREDSPVLHLGEAGGVHALYNCRTGQVERVAAPQVQLDITVEGASPGRAHFSVQEACWRRHVAQEAVPDS
ncbi:hypothetical protein ACFWZ2_25640 [Streptomyces sp. NPDC059002]|uniref:hypothetical protein n=1 Tax=Streptomyces sp. NPDC059002 TaxID=3346690 RepID=UPI0036C47738